MIYDNTNARLLLGCLLQNPNLLKADKVNLSKKDFPQEFHKTLYTVIEYLQRNNAQDISAIDISSVVEKAPKAKKVMDDNRYIEAIPTFKALSKLDNFQMYYDAVKRCTLLRDLDSKGYSVDKYIDSADNIDDIVSDMELMAVSLKREYVLVNGEEEYLAGSDFAETKEKLKESPLIGNSFQSEFLNDIFRGIYGFLLRGAKSGAGKSILSIGDLCKCSITEYYDYEQQKFIKNKSRDGSGLLINTELSLREELDPIIIAWISGVSRSHIIDGDYEDGEEDRVDYANKVLADSKLYIIDMPNFTTKSLVEAIRDYHYKYNIKTVSFDYIMNNGYVAKEISSETKVSQREDMVLLALTDRLKQVQRECGISLLSAVQLNGQEDNMDNPNESCLAGGKSQVRKTDGTMIMMTPKKKEIEYIMPILSANPSMPIPNNVIHIVKGRGSKYPKNIKVWQYIDLGTGRSTDLFCSDRDNNLIDVKRLKIEVEDE